jgi:hypothetical protein
MEKINLKLTKIAISIFISLFILLMLVYQNRYTVAQEYVSAGKLVGKETHTVGNVDDGGSTLGLVIHYSFKLDSGEEIGLNNQPFCAALVPGSRIRIFYHKSLFFKKVIYDYCKPL